MKPEDVEKGHETPSLHCVSPSELENSTSDTKEKEALEYKPRSFWQKCLDKLKQSEAHGIRQVPMEDRQPVTASTSMHMLLMWFSMTLATNNIVVGSMGTLVLGMRFRDAAFCAVFGNLLGAATVACISTWGPQSGNRTLVCFVSPFASLEPEMILVMYELCADDATDCGPLLHGLLSQQSLLRAECLHQRGI